MADVILQGDMILTGLTKEERLNIKNALTLPNPAYAAAKKFSKSGYVTRISENLFYFRQEGSHLLVPIGFDAEDYCDIGEVIDQRKNVDAKYPAFKLDLRDDQKNAAEEYLRYNIYERIPCGLIHLPTGKGKSILGIYLAAQLKQKTLVLVHKNDLVLAWRQDIKKCFGGKVKSGLIKGKVRDISPHITIATVQTLSRFSENEIENLAHQFGMIIADECHHSPARSYNLLSRFSSMFKLGLSATPERADGLTKVMHWYFGDFAYQYVYSKNEQDILPVEVILRESQFKYMPCVSDNSNDIENLFEYRLGKQVVKRDRSLITLDTIPYSKRPQIPYQLVDYNVLTDANHKSMVLGDIVNEFNAGSNSVVFFSQKEMCRAYYDELVKLIGAKNVQLFYGDSTEDDKTILDRAEKGKCRVTITTYAKGTEGTNCKSWDTAFLVSSLASQKNAEQAIGRIRRTAEGKRSVAKVYDYRHPYVHSWNKHGIIRDQRYWELKFKIPMCEKFSRGY